MLTHIDLFSGIGGFAIAAEWAGFRTVAFVEIDPYCQAVLKKHWPEVPIVGDIRAFKWPMADAESGRLRSWSGKIADRREASQPKWGDSQSITLLTGGFPCQPFSVAGKRRGKADDRYLWPEMLRVIAEVRPRWVLGENVAGIVRMALDQVLADLEGEGYSTQAFVIPACAVNAPHRRDRVWIVARDTASPRGRWAPREISERKKSVANGIGQDVADSTIKRLEKQIVQSGYLPIKSQKIGNNWAVEPDMGRVAHGIPSRVDRLKALGNAVVPQVAYQIIRGIAEIEKGGRR